MIRKLFFLILAALTTQAYSFDINIPVTYDSLKNGLRIIVVPDTHVAVVSCRLYYFVGSMYEGPGSTGLSHMYEHMMFKGTQHLGTTDYKKEVPIMRSIDSLELLVQSARNANKTNTDSVVSLYTKQIFQLLDNQRKYIKKDEIWELYQNNGATHLNAWTADDMTAYIVTLPQNKLDLFYWIESDRMFDPVLREFNSERDVVFEERRMRYDNQPVNSYWERLNSLFYVAHPYRLPTIGWQSDIMGYTRKRLEEHVNKYYTPDNALIVLSGNVNPKKAISEIERYFGHIPRAVKPKQEVVTREPAPLGLTQFTVYEDAEPRIDMMFHTPGYPNEDLFRLDVIEQIFSGRSGRLYSKLVDKEGLCTDAGAENAIRLQDGYFHVWAELRQDADPAKVEKILKEEIAQMKKNPPTDKEMLRVKNEIRMSFVSSIGNLEGLSDQLAFFERLRSWKDMLTYPDKIASVKKIEIADVAKKYLNTDIMTLGELLPKPGEPKGKLAPSTVGKGVTE